VQASTVSRTDCGMLEPHPFFVRLGAGLLRPKLTTLGMDFAGEVEALGAGVTAFAPGDRVFGLSPEVYGAHAEYLCVAAGGAIATLPAGTRFGEAVVCEGAWYADTVLRALRLGPGHQILIHGASGAIGTAAVQLAKARGAVVTAVVATRHLDLARSLGAARVLDYTAQDFTQIDDRFDFVFDAVGKTTYGRCRRLLKPAGVFAVTDLGPWGQNVLLAIGSSLTRRQRVVFPLPQVQQARAVVELVRTGIEAGDYRPVIDRRYPLAAIADAYRYVQTQRKTGVVVIDMGGASGPERAGR
jgi:NADPH:quinone reductase-like Zn-dependent oxidoreductase